MAYPGFGRPCRATHPGLWRGRPYRALSLSSYGLPRVWSPLQGYAPWALGGVAPVGAYSPSRSQQSKEYNLQHKGPRASHPPPRYCASIHGHCGISSQGAAVCVPKAPQFCSRVLRYFLPRHSSMRFQVYVVCALKELRFLSWDSGIPSKGAAIWVPTGTWVHAPQGSAVPLKALRYAPPRGCQESRPAGLSPYRGDPFQSPGCVALQGRPNPG